MQSTLMQDTKTRFILVTLLLIGVVVFAQNMLQYPYYQDAEGTNISKGWALISNGDLSPYTYAYDEPPAGSVLLSLWTLLSGGASAFGFPVNSGRILMLVFHLATSALVYGIARKTAKSDLSAVLATVIFAFSPLAVSLQRRVLLDNMMIAWLLLALYLILGEKRSFRHYLASATFFGLAVLTKGAAVGFLPAFAYIIHLRAHEHHRRFASSLWTALAIFLISLYPLYAQLKQELFPSGTLLGGDYPHVSLIQSLMDRGPETGRFLNIGTGFSQSFSQWVDLSNTMSDPVLIYAGAIGFIFLVLASIDRRDYRPVVAMNLGYVLYLVVRGPVFDTDVIALLPFLALNVGLVAGGLSKVIAGGLKGTMLRYPLAGVALLAVLYPFGVFYSNRLDLYTLDQVEGQLQAIRWLNEHVPADAVIVADNYAFVELRQRFDHAHHHWRVDTDPEIKFDLLEDDLCNIDYILWTPQVLADIQTYSLDLMRRAYENSELLVRYPNNGWPVEIRQVSKLDCAAEVASDTIDPDI
jgi:4-amino-4-deoxy-L-arabinose transferase-like glycosyltransferase